ncbi:MAG: hypothetical protein ABIY55_30645 [Kofleriaceae bacterium]
MTTRAQLLTLTALLLGPLAGCGDSTAAPDSISVTFSEAMDPATLTAATAVRIFQIAQTSR